jgi:hypothetical protein
MNETDTGSLDFTEQVETGDFQDGRQSSAALALQRGVTRLCTQQAIACLPEVSLPNHRRADLLALTPKGEIWIIELKSGLADFQADKKWHDYLDYCDRFYFAVAPDFPTDVLPVDVGYILADKYGGEIIREGQGPYQAQKLPAARRTLVTRLMARVGAFRWSRHIDPSPQKGMRRSNS